MRTTIAVAGVCLLIVLGGASHALAQDAEALAAPTDDDASAPVELSMSISPTLALGAFQPAGPGAIGLGGLGGVGIAPTMDVGFAMDRSTYFVLGLSGSFTEGPQTTYAIGVPLSVLWYLEPPRVGRVMPMLRVGASFAYAHGLELGGAVGYDWLSVGALVRGGLTWMLSRSFAIRAELGIRGGVGTGSSAVMGLGGGLGFDGLVGAVLRLG